MMLKKIKINHTIHQSLEITILFSHNPEWVALIVGGCYYIIKIEYNQLGIITLQVVTVIIKISKDYELLDQAEGHQFNFKTILDKCIIGID